MATSNGSDGLRGVVPTFGHMPLATYNAKVNTPARNPSYFQQFHAPLIERAATSNPGQEIVLLDVACGSAQELDFLKDDPRIQLVGVDLAKDSLAEAAQRLPRGRFYCWDVKNKPPLPPDVANGSADAGLALNAMIYVPDRMLAALKYGLKRGGEAAINFRVHGNPFNEVFYRYYLDRKGQIREEQLLVPTEKGATERFPVVALDYRECIDPATGQPDPIRNLVIQLYFNSRQDIQRLIEIMGFEINSHAPFHFASPVNADNEIDVYTIKKSL